MFTERTQVLLPPEQAERLTAIAERQGRPVGTVIRDAIDAYHLPPQRTKQETIEEAIDTIVTTDVGMGRVTEVRCVSPMELVAHA